MRFPIPIENEWSYKHLPRNRDLKLDIPYHCNSPSRVGLIDWQGNCFVCGCESWLPISIGKIETFTLLEDIWTNPISKAIQADIDNKQYTHCAVERCGVKFRDINYKQYEISINIDESCNLACPSCRSGPIMLNSGPEFDLKLSRVNHVVDLLERFEHPVHVIMSGNGDVLASAIMRPLIHRWRPKENQTLRLFTNGLLLRKQLTDSPVTDHITQYFISTDAGSGPVYEVVRRPGKWENLIDNLDFLKETVDRTGAEVLLRFVMQASNWNDMENFAKLCKHYGFKGNIAQLEDWNSFTDSFERHNVFDKNHPEHAKAMAELKRIIQTYCVDHNFFVDQHLAESFNS